MCVAEAVYGNCLSVPQPTICVRAVVYTSSRSSTRTKNKRTIKRTLIYGEAPRSVDAPHGGPVSEVASHGSLLFVFVWSICLSVYTSITKGEHAHMVGLVSLPFQSCLLQSSRGSDGEVRGTEQVVFVESEMEAGPTSRLLRPSLPSAVTTDE